MKWGFIMTKPEMILFDYGHTLIYEPGFNRLRGNEAILSHATRNPKGVTAEQLKNLYHEYIGNASEAAGSLDLELRNLNKNKLVFDLLGLEFDLPPVELENLFWDNAGPGTLMPHIEELIDYINAAGIRSGVVSNISFCGDNLKRRINRLLPRSRFEFIIASSDYIIRKPNRLIFMTALSKADLEADKVWFCGDNLRADIKGAGSAGILPVWYDSGINCSYRTDKDIVEPGCDYLRIGNWPELIEILKKF
jgi:putative hydrolase of the HAD superfamily